jgi:hypothetical protein
MPDDVLIQFGPPYDEHLLLETCRGIKKYIKKECVKLAINQNYVKMHGQQNIKYMYIVIHTCAGTYTSYIHIVHIQKCIHPSKQSNIN